MIQADEVRTAADIVKIVGDYVKLRKAGANFMGLCPFHQEKTPSFAVHPTKQIFHCFGCGVGGDVFKFVMLIENLSFPEALRRVAEKAGVPIREQYRDETMDANARERTTLQKIHEAAAKFFASQLGGTAEGRAARAYLADRGLSDEIVGRFRIGYAPSDGQALTRRLQEAGFETEILVKSGLILRDAEGKRTYDRFRRRIIFPIARESGKVVAFGGRALGDDQPKYLNSPETPIYTKSRMLYHLDRAGPAIRKLDYAILVEGYMDCIAVASAGVENVVATCGTSLTDGQTRLLGRYSRRVVVNYDPDSAGVAATERSLNLLLEQGFEAKVLALPGGLDPDSFIRQLGPEAYREGLAGTPTYIDYLTTQAMGRHDVDTPGGKAAVMNALIPIIVRIPDALKRGTIARNLLQRIKIADLQLYHQVMNAVGIRQAYEVPPERFVPVATPAEKQLLRAFMESQELADEFLAPLVESGDSEGLAMEGIFRRLLEAQRAGESLEVSSLELRLEAGEQRLLYECAFGSGDPPTRVEVLGCLQALRRRKAEKERERLQMEIQTAEREKDHARLVKLLEAKARLAKELAQLRGQ